MRLAPYDPFFGQHIKTAVDGVTVDRGFVAHYVIPAAKAVAAGAANVLAATALADGDVTEVTKNITNPPTPRVLAVKGNDAAVKGDVVIVGTDAAGAALTETIVAKGADSVVGKKAFATITKITLPAFDTADTETISVGLSTEFGLPYKLPYDTVLKIYNDSTATTVAAGSSFSGAVLADNYIKPTAALNAKQIDVYMIV